MKPDNPVAMKIQSIIHTTSHVTRCDRASAALGLTLLIAFASAPAATQAEQDTAQSANAQPAQPLFDIYEYKIEGNSRLAELDIARAVTPFLGEGKTLSEVEAARAGLQKAYHEAGYLTVVVSIPEQNVDSGVVALQVVEAEVERLRVKGSEYHTLSGIKERVPELAEGNVPNFPKMQQELAALNRAADLKATPILRAGKLPGKVEVQLDIDDQLPLHGSVDYSNRQSPNTTAQRLSASVRYDNLWQRRHSLGLTLQTSPENSEEVRVAAGTYVLPVGSAGDALSTYAVVSRSKFANLANSPGLGVLGNADIVGLRYAMPLPGLNSYSHYLSFGADYKNIKQSVVVAGAGDVTTPITYLPLAATYTGNWLGQRSTTSLDAAVTLGVRGLFGNRNSEFAAKRAGASANFFVLRTGLQRTETFGRWTLSGKLEVQLASGPLVSNEQYNAGGAESVRGYLEGERTGDHALRASVELRTPQFKPAGETSPWRLTGLAFFDAARLRTEHAVFPQPRFESLRGAGFGLRLAAPRGLMFELDAAHALDDADITRAGSNRAHARMLWEY
jgi:hemolysin activation/secretion protein